jgi:predicted MPP superfamily phosphohydrolase
MKRVVTIIFCILFILLLWYFFYHENTDLNVTKYDIKDKKINNKFVIAQISDFHNNKYKKLNNELINNLKLIKPDVIVITGDFIDSRRTNINVSVNFIKEIKDISPIYYVNGNHESRIEDYKLFKEKLIDNDVIVLENDIKEIKYKDNIINIIGISDPRFIVDKKDKEKEIINEELRSIDYDKYIYTILLTHRPEYINEYSKENINLVLSGHAHGGQINIPLIGPLYAPGQGLFPKYINNMYKVNNTNMIVSRGIGNSLMPFRINNKPELVIVELDSVE